jgi:hypothetical protein
MSLYTKRMCPRSRMRDADGFLCSMTGVGPSVLDATGKEIPQVRT